MQTHYPNKFINIFKISLDGAYKSNLHDDNFVIAIDSIVLKLQTEENRLNINGKVKRGSLKRHIVVDNKRKRILSLDVTSEQIHDSKVLPILIEDITIKQNKIVDSIIADGTYDNNKNFQFLSFKGIKSSIKVRKNSRCCKTNHIPESY